MTIDDEGKAVSHWLKKGVWFGLVCFHEN